MSRPLATGCWLLAREEVWKTFLRQRSLSRSPLQDCLLANRWRAARLDVSLLASRQTPAASSQREVLA